jgi:DNA-binding IclR family transcriptional regulator
MGVQRIDVERLAHSLLERLADEMEDTVHLAARSGFDALGVGAFSIPLLTLQDDDVTRVIAHDARRLVDFTDSIATLTAYVAQARKRGYAVTGRLR